MKNESERGQPEYSPVSKQDVIDGTERVIHQEWKQPAEIKVVLSMRDVTGVVTFQAGQILGAENENNALNWRIENEFPFESTVTDAVGIVETWLQTVYAQKEGSE